MFRVGNFIYLFSVSGFFIGLLFAILQELKPFEFLISVLVIFVIFYILALASTSFFIKYLSVKNIFKLDKLTLEKTIDAQIDELDKKEDIIRESYYFIKQIEEEEFNLYKQSSNSKDKR